MAWTSIRHPGAWTFTERSAAAATPLAHPVQPPFRALRLSSGVVTEVGMGAKKGSWCCFRDAQWVLPFAFPISRVAPSEHGMISFDMR